MSSEEPRTEQQPEATEERRGGRGGIGRGRGGKGGRGRNEEEAWVPLTNLGRLVQAGIITKLEEIYYHSIPIKEYQIVDELIKMIKL